MTALEEYLRSTEPGRREKAYAWKTAIGLQQVDGLTPSDYLIKTACRNIEGEITLEEFRKLIEGYYKSRPQKREQVGEQVREQVKVDAGPDSAHSLTQRYRLTRSGKASLTTFDLRKG